VRLGVHRPTVRAGSRLELATLGLAERGHALAAAGRAAPGSALASLEPARAGEQIDAMLGGARPLGPAWWGARLHARALVLSLEAAPHGRWSLPERWAWGVSGAYGVIDEHESSLFLARVPEAERERLALWPAEAPRAEAVVAADTNVLELACERALARRAAGPGRSALFVDRDGTLIEERHHLSEPDAVSLLPGVPAALRAVRAQGHPVVVISNQAGVARGLFPESRVHEVMARLRRLLRAEGVELDAVRFCPHAPDAGCDCRKPRGRLLRDAAEDLRLSLRDSIMVGDRWIDVDAGRDAGATGVLVRTGYGAEEERASAEREQADPVFDDLPAAAAWFQERQG